MAGELVTFESDTPETTDDLEEQPPPKPLVIESLFDREAALEAVERCGGSALRFASEKVRDDRDVVMAAVVEYGEALRYADVWSRADRAVVLAAVQSYGPALEHVADEELRDDREVVLAAVRQKASALAFASHGLKAEANFMTEAAQVNGRVLEYCDAALRDDRSVVMAAVQQRGDSLRFASAALQGDKDVVMAAVAQQGTALVFASEALRDSMDVVLAACRQNGDALEYGSEEMRNNGVIVKAAVRGGGAAAFLHASAALKADRKFVLELLEKKNGPCFEHVAFALKVDKLFVLEAVRMDRRVIEHVDSDYLTSWGFLRDCMEINGGAFNCLGHRDRRLQDLELGRVAVHSLVDALKVLAPPLGEDDDSDDGLGDGNGCASRAARVDLLRAGANVVVKNKDYFGESFSSVISRAAKGK